MEVKMSDEFQQEQENKKQPERVKLFRCRIEIDAYRIRPDHSTSFRTGEIIAKSIKEFIAGILAQRIERSIMHGLDLDPEGGIEPSPPHPRGAGFIWMKLL